MTKHYILYLPVFLIACLAASLVVVVKAQDNMPPQPDPPIVRGFMGSPRDADQMKEWWANVIRVFGIDRMPNLDEQIIRLRELNMKLVVCGGMGDFNYSDPLQEERLIKMWTNIATKLLPYRDVIWGYDLLNEPKDRKQIPNAPKEWPTLAAHLIQAIRNVNDRTWIIYEVGPGERMTGFINLEPLPDKRVIYGCHYYLPHQFTHAGVTRSSGTGLTKLWDNIDVHYPMKLDEAGYNYDAWLFNTQNISKGKYTEWNKDLQKKAYQPVVDFQKKYDVPIYIGEFSTVRWGHVEDSICYLREAIELFEENGWSWSYHCFNGGWSGWNPEHPEGQGFYWMQ